MKREHLFIFILAATLIFSGTAFAQDTLTIIFKDGRKQVINYHDVLRIDFQSAGAVDTQPYGSRDLNVEGLWKTSNGDLRLWQTGNQITGSYPVDNGEVVGQIRGNILTGYWIEDKANQKCSYPKNGRYYWGKLMFVFDGNKFRGTWGYCDANPSITDWTGSR